MTLEIILLMDYGKIIIESPKMSQIIRHIHHVGGFLPLDSSIL